MINFSQARKNMVDTQIATNGVTDPLILSAFSSIPREIFASKTSREVCYSDQSIEIEKKRYLIAPMVFAKLIQAAHIKSHEVVLDIACGSGYSSAILSSLASTVIAVESVDSFIPKAERLWKDVSANNIVGLTGDLLSASKKDAPYDVIFLNGAVSEIPDALVSQLAENGRMLCIVRGDEFKVGRAVMVVKGKDSSYTVKNLFEANIPFITEFSPTCVFSF